MLKLYLKMAPKAGGEKEGWGTEGDKSPMYQGTAIMIPKSLFFCPEAAKVRNNKVMMSNRLIPPCRPAPLAVEFLEDRPSVPVVPDFKYALNTYRIV